MELSIINIIWLATVDAVNPCAIAVLSLMLISIITYDPKNRKNILLSGFAFIVSVFFIYLLYGLVIIRFFQIVQGLTEIRLILYELLGVIAIIIGVLNIKDFIRYRPGGIMTEMPIKWRPKAKEIISNITSPKGAAAIGAFVTVFLLPCTMGPYLIAGGILSIMRIIQTLPWLLLYNFIFVLPMIVITLLVYTGISKVDDITGWKATNIRKLHFISGIIMIGIGFIMITGII